MHVFSGKCLCDTGFIGGDCSHPINKSPENIFLPEEGLCRQSIRPCAKTNIVGTFLSGTTIYVKLQQYKVSIYLCDFLFALPCEKISFSPLKLNVITLAIVIYIILCTCRYRSWVKGQLSTQKRQRHNTELLT